MTTTPISETTASTGEVTRVVHNGDLKRYEIWLDEAKVGHADYSLRPGEIHFVHTEVDPAHQGKNLAAILTRESVNAVREAGSSKIVPVCSYVVRYMERHPETHDLLLNPIEEAAAACRIDTNKFSGKA
jgi:predicted GNAT family acetyltransferase